MDILPCCSSAQCALKSSVRAINLSENFGGVATNIVANKRYVYTYASRTISTVSIMYAL